jgi:hypothetical protein
MDGSPDYADADLIADHIEANVPLAPLRLIRSEAEAFIEPDVDLDAEPAKGSDSGAEVPPHLLEVPGLVGAITRWINETALYPQPVLALGAALVVVGTAAGRKYSGPTKSATHLYCLGIAPTGAGKNHASKMAKRLMRAADQADLIGPGQFMSEPAVYETVCKRPQLLCFMDEFGGYLQKINSPRGSGYEKAVTAVLRILWGASFDTIDPPAWASRKGANELKPIQSPALSIYGMSVPEEFYAALNSADIANGFLNRFLILPTQIKPEEVVPPRDEDIVPAALIDNLQRIAASGVDPRRPRQHEGVHLAEERITWAAAGGAQAIYQALRKGVDQRGGDEAKLLSRTPEMAVRLATIRAIGRGKPVVDADDMRWGAELATWSGERIIADAYAYMVESEHQGRAKEVLRHLKAAPGRKMTRTELYRKVKYKFDGRQLTAVLSDMQESGEIEMVSVPGSDTGAKKPTFVIRLSGR